MDGLEQVFGYVVGEGGALVVLLLVLGAWLRGYLYSRNTIELLEREHTEYAKQAEAQTIATEELVKATAESLENSKLILDIIEKARDSHEKA